MGSLKQVDPDVTAAPKAALLQDVLLVHLLTSLHPCLWALRKGGNHFITGMSLLGMGKEADLGRAAAYGERRGRWPFGQVAVIQHCTATPCCKSSHSRVMDRGERCGDCQEAQGPIRSC